MLTRSLVHLFCAVIIYKALQKDGEVVLADAIPRKVDDSCTFFYKPCECYTFLPQGEMQITCRNLSPQQVFDVFTQDSIPSSDITYFVFEMSDPNQTYIPANLLGSRKVLSSINLQWTAADTEGLLMINPDAFRSSDESLLYLIIDGFNVQNLEWSFLEGFDSLLALQMSNLVDVKKLASSLTNFGSNLTHLYAYNCTELTDIPGVISALRVAEFSNTTIGIESASKILTKLLKVNETLERLVFDYAPIQIIPGEMNMFSNTEFLAIKNAEISIVQEGAFNVSPSIFSPQHIRQISLSNNKITKIMPGAFGSSLSYSLIYLDGNQLSQFEASVFRPMLQDMYRSTKGGLYVGKNPFVCDCHIAWLIRDYRYLLDYVFDATCSDSTLFAELDPEQFSDC